MTEPQSLTMFAKTHNIDRDELLSFLIECGVVKDIRTITDKGLKLGIKYKKGEKAGIWPVYGVETEELIKGHSFNLKDNKKRIYTKSKSDQFIFEFESLLNQDKYIARSDYMYLIDLYKDEYDDLISLKRKNMLQEYAEKNNFNFENINTFLNHYEDIFDIIDGSKIVKKHNNEFISKHLIEDKDYLDNILNSNVRLDIDQRKVVLSDEDYTLVVAGAGAGKSTTVAAKVKYLIEKKNIKPSEILVISFTNESVRDLIKKIQVGLGINCDICTFHKVGYKIIKDDLNDSFNVAVTDTLYWIIDKYLKTEVLKDPIIINNLILFFSYYLDVPFDETDTKKVFDYIANSKFETLKSYIPDISDKVVESNKLALKNNSKVASQKVRHTINNEIVNSSDEVDIANFLFLNSLEYEYEKNAPFKMPNSRKIYTPDFYIKQGDNAIWYEHFGIINEDGTSNRPDDEVVRYKKDIKDKIKLFKEKGIKLIYTFHKYNDGRSILEHLKENLIDNGFELKERPKDEVYKKIVDNAESKYIKKLSNLIVRFISNFKSCGYSEEKFKEFINENKNSKKAENVRKTIFLEICLECYHEYQKQLNLRHEIDFQDMINDSRRILEEAEKSQKGLKKDYGYKYIIVDEFQDISKQRFDFTAALSKVTNAKIMAVGDDWQSIYAFSGSVLDSFIEFNKRMGYGEELSIVSTHRNSQELLDIAGTFVMQNDKQKKKPLISSKKLDKPVIIKPYDDTNIPLDAKGDKFYAYGMIVEKIIEDILKNDKTEGRKETNILLIGRYNLDGYNLSQRTGLFEYNNYKHQLHSIKYPNVKLRFLTAHRSKGLDEDNVIILNAKNDLLGFPTKIDNEPILSMVTKIDDSIEYAEERRLFYVALTRTRNRVYIAVPKNKPSQFIIELMDKKIYKNVECSDEINISEINFETNMVKKCPHCGYPMQFQYNKHLNKKLWICKNEKELCGFMTNDLNGGKLSILRCDDPKCKDGYLVVRKNKNNNSYFLGCTNFYTELKCQRQMPLSEYLALMDGGEI